MYRNKLPYEEFAVVEKDKKDCSSKNKTIELVQIYLIFLNKNTITTGTNFLAFSVFYYWIRIQEGQ